MHAVGTPVVIAGDMDGDPWPGVVMAYGTVRPFTWSHPRSVFLVAGPWDEPCLIRPDLVHAHADYPHEHGYFLDCYACTLVCFCGQADNVEPCQRCQDEMEAYERLDLYERTATRVSYRVDWV